MFVFLNLFQKINHLRWAYDHVEDIDLFVGMILEDATNGPIGDTFRCLIVDVFARVKFGDRYFYDNGGQAGSFTGGKLYVNTLVILPKFWNRDPFSKNVIIFSYRAIGTNSKSIYGKNYM